MTCIPTTQCQLLLTFWHLDTILMKFLPCFLTEIIPPKQFTKNKSTPVSKYVSEFETRWGRDLMTTDDESGHHNSINHQVKTVLSHVIQSFALSCCPSSCLSHYCQDLFNDYITPLAYLLQSDRGPAIQHNRHLCDLFHAFFFSFYTFQKAFRISQNIVYPFAPL